MSHRESGRLTVSACLIVKDEQANLARCLASLQGFVDEIVVVDTGSMDDTVAIARSFGATVGHFDWCEDFAAARNASLELATSDWVLVIDADEELSVGDSAWRAALEAQTVFTVAIRSLNDAGEEMEPLDVLRVFPRDPAVRYRGRVHEGVGEGLPEGWRVGALAGLRLRHHGYTSAAVAAGDKIARYLRLAEREAAEHPEVPQSWFHLCRTACLAGRVDRAHAAYDRLLALADGPASAFVQTAAGLLDGILAAAGMPARREPAVSDLDRALAALERHELDGARVALLAHLEARPRDGHAFRLLGEVLLLAGEVDKALVAARWAIALRSEAACYDLLGRLLEALGQFQLAERAYAAALGLDPDHPTALESRLACRRQPATLAPDSALEAEVGRMLAFARPTVSACLIVKDEQANLGRCLASLQGFVDEIVVVDTGSTDDTVAIAESFGATVGHFDWCDDFAAARNASLELATSDWVLVIDADEALAQVDFEAWQAALRNREPGAYMVGVDDVQGGEVVYRAPLLRVFQRLDGVAFEHRLHESVGGSLARLGLAIAGLDALVLRHDGYDPAAAAAPGKGPRNERLARLELADRPGDPLATLNLARSLRTAEADPDEALALYERVQTLAGFAALPTPLRVLHAQGLHELYLARGRDADALAVLDRAIAAIGDHPELRYERGKLRANMGNALGAIADFEACLAAPAHLLIGALRTGITDRLPREALARVRAGRRQTVSACLIVKDEQANLGRCLASLQGFVDEIVVVDTGSTDDTVAIARSFGATVGHFDWCEDFAAARNASLELANSDWVLVIDADEALCLEDAEAWGRALEARDRAYLVPIHNLDDAGQVESVTGSFPRLFPRHPAARFEGRLHESPGASLVAMGCAIETLPCAWLRHGGYTDAAIARTGKVARNRLLAERMIAEDPTNPDPWHFLANTLWLAKDVAGTLAALAELRRLQAAGHKLPVNFQRTAYQVEAWALAAVGRNDEALAVLDEALDLTPGYVEYLYERGRVRMALGHEAGAIADLEACLATPRGSVQARQGVTGFLAHAELVAIYAGRERFDLAARHLRAGGEDPACPPDVAARMRALAAQLGAAGDGR